MDITTARFRIQIAIFLLANATGMAWMDMFSGFEANDTIVVALISLGSLLLSAGLVKKINRE